MVQTSYAAVLIAAVALNAATSSLANPHTDGEIDIRAVPKSKPSTSRRVGHAAHKYGPSILENGLPLLGQLWGSHQSTPPAQAQPVQRNYDPIYDLVSRAVAHHQSKTPTAPYPAAQAAHVAQPKHNLGHAVPKYGPSILEKGLPLLGQLWGSHQSNQAPAPAPASDAPVEGQGAGADGQGVPQRREEPHGHPHVRLGLAAGRHANLGFSHGPARLGAEHFQLGHGPALEHPQGATPGAVEAREFDDEMMEREFDAELMEREVDGELMEREHSHHHEHEEDMEGEFDDEEYDDDEEEEEEFHHGHSHSHGHPYKHLERLD